MNLICKFFSKQALNVDFFFVQGNLEKAVFLTEYSKTHDIQSIDDFLSVSMNVHDDGNVLEIVGMCCKLTLANILSIKMKQLTEQAFIFRIIPISKPWYTCGIHCCR